MVSTVAQICKQSWTSVVRAALIQSNVPSVPATFQGVIGPGHVRESMQPSAVRFEHSSSNRTPIIGLDAALGLFECIDGGMQAVESRILGLTAHTIAGLERLGYPVVFTTRPVLH